MDSMGKAVDDSWGTASSLWSARCSACIAAHSLRPSPAGCTPRSSIFDLFAACRQLSAQPSC